MAATLLKLIKDRRSYYPLSKDLPISASRIEEIVSQLITDVPSSFNSQSNRAILLLGAEHDKLWDIAVDALKPVVPEENWKPTGDKLAMFKGAAGTVLFFEDQDVVDDLQNKFALYADKFPVWADQSAGMLVSLFFFFLAPLFYSFSVIGSWSPATTITVTELRCQNYIYFQLQS